MRTLRIVLATAAVALVPRLAHAQEAVVSEIVSDDNLTADRISALEGHGYTLTPGLVLHPSIALQGGDDTNVFYQASGEGTHGSAFLRLTGGVYLSTDAVKTEDLGTPDPNAPEQILDPTPRTYDLRGGAQVSYQENLSGSEVVRSQRRLNALAMANFVLYPTGPFTLTVDEHFVRDIRSPNFETTDTLDRDDNRINASAGWRSEGNVISVAGYYENWLEVFENGPDDYANRLNQKLGVLAGWQLFPVTRLMADVSYGFDGPIGTSTVHGMPYKTESHPIRAVVGGATELTSMWNLKVHAGVAHASYEVGDGYTTWVGGAELGMRWAPTGRAVLLYDHDAFDSLNANFYVDHMLAARAIQQVGKLVFDGGPELRFRHFGGIPAVLGADERDDVIVAIAARAQIVVHDMISLSAEYRFETVQTDYKANQLDAMNAPVGTDDPSYVRHELVIGVRAAY